MPTREPLVGPPVLDFPQAELTLTFGIFTGCVQNSIKVFTNPLNASPEGYDWYWILMAVFVLFTARFWRG